MSRRPIDSVPVMRAAKRTGHVASASQYTHPWRVTDGRKYPVTVRRVATAF